MTARDAVVFGAVATMTSLELVEFINSERKADSEFAFQTEYVELAHRNFMAKVPTVLGEGCAKFLAHPRNPQNGQEYAIYEFPKREACLMAMSYSYRFQAKVFDRMTALEAPAAPQFAIPPTYAAALRLAAEQAEIIEVQAAQLVIAAPAIAFVGNYVTSTTGSKGFREVCKLLKANEAHFSDFLTGQKIMYRLGSSRKLMPYAAHLDTGRFEVKAGTSDISGHAFNTAKFTAKGIAWIAGEWAKFQVERDLFNQGE